MKRVIIASILWFCVFGSTSAGDVIRLMHNNLLHFGNFFDSCTEETNNPNDKVKALKVIVDYVQPDVFTVNELSTQPKYGKMILDKALNVDGDEWAYQPCGANSYGIGNGLFYKKGKFDVISAKVYSIGVRYADIIRMRTKNTTFENELENVEFTMIIVHFKAGSYAENVTQRGNEAKTLMNYIFANDVVGNVFLAGDFNLYRASEPAYQQLLFYKESDVRFYDPINEYGEWGSNAEYAKYHTQSTRDGYVECFSGGGLDDRFDFILTSNSVMAGTAGIKYVTDSYKAIGNDGKHYNKALLSAPTNSMYPQEIVEALTNSSDHLPIVADLELKVSFSNSIDNLYKSYDFNVSIANPVLDNNIKMTFKDVDFENYQFDIISISGELIYSERIVNNGFITINLPFGIKEGFYLGVITETKTQSKITKKIVIG